MKVVGSAEQGSDPREVVIGVSPGVGRNVWRTLSGVTVDDVLDELLAGLEEEGCTARIVRVNSTLDLGMVGLTAARLAGSGIGIGLQGKGTALIHRRDLPPLANLELYSMAPIITPTSTASSAPTPAVTPRVRHRCRRGTPTPTKPSSRAYHTSVIALVALEREHVSRGVAPEELEVVR